MRRSGVLSLLVAMVLSLWPAAAVAQAGESEIYTSQDGPTSLVTVEVPEGAAPPGASIAVATRDPDERPDELAGLPMSNPFYELRPLDARFSEPVTVTRLIDFQQLGFDSFDPVQHGLVVGSLFTRDGDGVWSWLDDVEVRVNTADNGFSVTGTMNHGGPIMGFIGANLIIAAENPPESTVGEVFRIEGLTRAQQESATDIMLATGSTSDPAIAVLIRDYEVEAFERAAGLEFECLAPGTVSIEVVFTVADVADVGSLNEPIGLGGTVVDVVHVVEHTCLASS